MLASAGIAIDGVVEKLVIIADTGSWNMVAQWAIIAACINVRKYAAPRLSVSLSMCLS